MCDTCRQAAGPQTVLFDFFACPIRGFYCSFRLPWAGHLVYWTIGLWARDFYEVTFDESVRFCWSVNDQPRSAYSKTFSKVIKGIKGLQIESLRKCLSKYAFRKISIHANKNISGQSLLKKKTFFGPYCQIITFSQGRGINLKLHWVTLESFSHLLPRPPSYPCHTCLWPYTCSYPPCTNGWLKSLLYSPVLYSPISVLCISEEYLWLNMTLRYPDWRVPLQGPFWVELVQ